MYFFNGNHPEVNQVLKLKFHWKIKKLMAKGFYNIFKLLTKAFSQLSPLKVNLHLHFISIQAVTYSHFIQKEVAATTKADNSIKP